MDERNKIWTPRETVKLCLCVCLAIGGSILVAGMILSAAVYSGGISGWSGGSKLWYALLHIPNLELNEQSTGLVWLFWPAVVMAAAGYGGLIAWLIRFDYPKEGEEELAE